jgi:hypothetical protein
MWKVVDYMEGVDGNARYPSRMPTVYGPLPVKVWVRVKGERHRKAFRQTKAHQGNAPRSAKDYTAARAELYARWLAQRDGVLIPDDCIGVPVWDTVDIPGKPKPELRVHSVVFKRKYPNGRVDPSDTRAVIAIPHWDWVPTCTEETLDLQLAA